MRTKIRVASASPAPVLRLKHYDSPTFGMPDQPARASSDSFKKSNFLTFQSNEGLELRVHIAGAPQQLIGDAETAFSMAQVNGYFKEQSPLSPQEGAHRGGRVASMTRTGMLPCCYLSTSLTPASSGVSRSVPYSRSLPMVISYWACKYWQVRPSYRTTTRRH